MENLKSETGKEGKIQMISFRLVKYIIYFIITQSASNSF